MQEKFNLKMASEEQIPKIVPKNLEIVLKRRNIEIRITRKEMERIRKRRKKMMKRVE